MPVIHAVAPPMMMGTRVEGILGRATPANRAVMIRKKGAKVTIGHATSSCSVPVKSQAIPTCSGDASVGVPLARTGRAKPEVGALHPCVADCYRE